MNNKSTAIQYLEYLRAGDTPNILSLFHKDAMVHSPIYGSMLAREFYTQLASDTIQSQITLKTVFEDVPSRQVALYFNYVWTMANNEAISFDVVDIILFEDDKIIELTIIYDASLTKALFNNTQE